MQSGWHHTLMALCSAKSVVLVANARMILPALPPLRNALQQIGGTGFDEQCLSRLRTPGGPPPLDAWTCWQQERYAGIPICAMMRLSSRDCTFFHGPLTAWDDEVLVQALMQDLPEDAYTLRVEEVKQVVDLQEICFKKSRHHGSAGLAKLSLLHPLFTGAWFKISGDVLDANSVALCRQGRSIQATGVGDAGRTISAGDLLRHWGLPG